MDNARMPTRRLVLASTSRYRRELLSRLRLPFDVEVPAIDEQPRAGETPAQTAARLALAKAEAVAARHPEAVVVGSDQVADLDGRGVGKPGDHERATAQLRAMRGKTVVFQTAVAVVCAATRFAESTLVPVAVKMRELTDDEIEHYLRAEMPYDCAGSAKIETLGIALVESVDSDDPTALVGLPLIRTCELLRRAGIDPLAGARTDRR
jgi:septum formation protein